jgi:MFS superfamily sulfate permease-like transporter
MVGAILIAGGLIRLGWIADLLSKPVITGFLAGISVHIILSQAPTVLGLQNIGGSVFERVAGIAAHIGETKPLALLIGLGVLAVTFACEGGTRACPAP